MSPTVGRGPFATEPAGRFNTQFESPTGAVLFVDPVPQRIRALFGGETVVDSTHAKLLHETGHLPVRTRSVQPDRRLPDVPARAGDRRRVRLDLLEPSPKRTRCAYKGSASYWHLRAGGELHDDLAWSYANPQHDADLVRAYIAFFNERGRARNGPTDMILSWRARRPSSSSTRRRSATATIRRLSTASR